MQKRNYPRLANRFVVSACLLAVTAFMIGSWQSRAESPTAAQSNESSAPAGGVMTLARHTPAEVLDGKAIRLSHYNPEQKLRLVLTVQPPHMAEEEQFIKELTTKGKPNFHKFLTQEEWNARFGPSQEDEQAVVDWAQSQGLTVTHRYPNRLLVDVEGTSGAIEKVFGVTINNYQVGEEVDFSNDRDPVIPANLSGILRAVTGLSNVERTHRIGSRIATVKGADYVPGPAISEAGSAHRAGDPTKAPWARPTAMTSRAAAKNENGSPTKPKANDNYPLDYMSGTYAMDPDNVQSSNGYDYNALQKLSFCCNQPGDSGGSPPESSIALVGYGGFNLSDVNTFVSAYGMAYLINSYCIDGSPCPGNDGEAPLDVEYSLAMSNSYGSEYNTAHIFEYEMTNNLYTTYEDAFNDVMNDGHAKVVSTSYGWQENVGFSGSVATGTMHPIFNNMVGVGITLIAASGDNGASDGCGDATSVDYPSSDPDFIAAGGTQLNMNTSGIFQSETAWQGENWSGACGSNHGGSTGGVSVLFPAPAWQVSATNSTYPTGVVSPFYLWKDGTEYVETGNGNRMVPDISLTANPDVLGQWYVSGGSWQDEGGTSIVAPELAGFFAQENTYLDYIGDACGSGGTTACSPVGNAAPFFYYNAIDGAPHKPFYDMLSGCDDNDVTAANNLYYYCAYAGYDPITGWGSANMMQLAWGINWEIIPADGAPSLTFGGPTINTWYNTDQIVDWDLTDGSSNGYTPPGIAGFTLGWDTIPSDSQSEPHGGNGDTFYSGPEYTYSGFGCVDNNGTLCEAASGQGCHTVYVRGWDNQGITTNGSYGPVCYDSVAPTITISNSPATPASGWWDSSVTVILTATDPGGSAASGIAKIYYAIDSDACYPGSVSACSIYTGPFKITAAGQHQIYYWAVDKAGNISFETGDPSTWVEPYEWVSIDLTPPVTTASLSGTLSGGKYYSNVQVTLSATDTGGSGVQSTYYTINGGTKQPYTAPFIVSTVGSNTVQYYSMDGAGNTEATHTMPFTITGLPATMSTPAPGSILGTSNVKFTWIAGKDATEYQLWLGLSGPGSSALYASGWLTTTSTTVTTLPGKGVTVYARLFSMVGGVNSYNDYTYVEGGAPATMVSPAPGSTLGTSNVKFSWTGGTDATEYQLWLGLSGPGSSALYASGWLTTTSTTVISLPAKGATVYARLYSLVNGVTQFNDYTYTEAPLGTPATMSTPAPGSTLGTSNVKFTWTPGTATQYQLWLGLSGPGSSALYASGWLTTTSTTVINLPAKGATVYARLYSLVNGVMQYNDYTYTEAAAGVPATMVSPTPGSTLGASNVTFTWTAGTGVTQYTLWLGTSGPGSSSLYTSGALTTTSTTVTSLPAKGATVYARLYSLVNGVTQYNDYTYTEQ
ncbi:MAG TPA: protease pro-enzyme activation domain-containing protein [Terracidiphilus sp.]|jgi:hypothetical protein